MKDARTAALAHQWGQRYEEWPWARVWWGLAYLPRHPDGRLVVRFI
jgi:hypothetical protein